MATIQKRARRDGSIGYTATVRIKKSGKIIYQETETFSREAAAREWARRREVELEKPETLHRAQSGGYSLEKLTDRYIEEFESISKWQRSKASGLRQLKNTNLGKEDATRLTTARLVAHVRERRAQGAGPATASNDLVWIGVVLRAAKSVWELPINPTIVEEAREICGRLRLVGKSRRRTRLPTYEELEALDKYFADRQARGRSEIPMRDIMWFAVYSTRRQAEITRIERADDNAEENTGIVRDAKHPRNKEGNHRVFRYTEEAWQIAKMQPKGEFAFPYESKTICNYFTHACQMLGIEDLHFHDLRHDGTTRLFERGWGIPQVAAVTLHESWNELKRYTHIHRRSKVFEAPYLNRTSLAQSSPQDQQR